MCRPVRLYTSGRLFSFLFWPVLAVLAAFDTLAYQIRHPYVTRAAVGHTTETLTARYDHSDFKKAVRVAKKQNEEYLRKKAVGCDCPPSEGFGKVE